MSNLDQNIILLLTAFIILIYTYYTYKLWKESKTQTILLQTPYLILRFDKESSKFYLKNISKNIATKIKIESYEMLMTDIKKDLKIEFNNIELLEPEIEKQAEYKVYENGEEISDAGSREFAIYFFPLIPNLDPQRKKKIIFKITYKNILGLSFYFDILVAENEYRIKRFGQYSWFRKLQHNLFWKLKASIIRLTVYYKRRSIRS
jgi:hypothetical protein